MVMREEGWDVIGSEDEGGLFRMERDQSCNKIIKMRTVRVKKKVFRDQTNMQINLNHMDHPCNLPFYFFYFYLFIYFTKIILLSQNNITFTKKNN